MKKYILFIGLLFAIVLGTSAQATIHTFKDGGYNNIAFTGAATDTVGQTSGGQLSIWKIIDMRSAIVPYYFYFTVNATKLSGNVAGDQVQIHGSMDGTTWTTLMNKTLSDATTACVFTRSDSIAFGYPYLRIYMLSDGGAGNLKMTSVYGKILPHKR